MKGSALIAVLTVSSALAAHAFGTPVRLEVPFFPDKTDQCGPSTLAGLLSFWGKPTDPSTLRQEMYTAKLRGTLPMDLVHTAKTRGLNARMVDGTLAQIRQELSEGRPVVAMLNEGLSMVPVGHYVIVTGFDDEKEGFYVHSGGKENRFVSYKKFEKKWKAVDHWAMLASSP